MTDVTPRLTLPMIAPGQAQKEMTHNEALVALDAAVQASAVAFGVDTPPVDPVPGACWIVGAAPVDAWAGHAGALAMWTAAGWRFVSPTDGFRVWIHGAGLEARFTGGGWTLGHVAATGLVLNGHSMLATPAAAISEPTGGATVDSEGRSAIIAILTALRRHNLVETA